MSDRTYYDVLGISPGADGTTVNRAYWQLARQYQAGEASDPRSHLMLDELNEAYNTLGTPSLRAIYDSDSAHLQTTGGDITSPVGPSARQRSALGEGMHHGAKRAWQSRRAWSPHAGIGLLAAASIGLGIWSGSMALTALGLMVSVVLGITPIRARLLSLWRTPAPRLSSADPTDAAPRLSAQSRSLSVSSIRRPTMKADDLRTSTASMVSRWRTSVASVAEAAHEPANAPDSTLVDIFRSEHDVETQAEPLSAVLDVLRGARSPAQTR